MDNLKLDSDKIEQYLKTLGKELRRQKIDGELIMCGGAVMLLGYGSRDTTADIDGIFFPRTEIKRIVRDIAEKNDLPIEWLNDSVKHSKSYVRELRQNATRYKNYYNLRVYFAKIDQMIAMKLIAFRVGASHDLEDLETLIKEYDTKIKPVTSEILENIVVSIYGNLDKLSPLAIEYIRNIEEVLK